jgi:hypothetical protein
VFRRAAITILAACTIAAVLGPVVGSAQGNSAQLTFISATPVYRPGIAGGGWWWVNVKAHLHADFDANCLVDPILGPIANLQAMTLTPGSFGRVSSLDASAETTIDPTERGVDWGTNAKGAPADAPVLRLDLGHATFMGLLALWG